MGLTLEALGLNLYMALVWPVLMAFVAYELREVSGTGTLSHGTGQRFDDLGRKSGRFSFPVPFLTDGRPGRHSFPLA